MLLFFSNSFKKTAIVVQDLGILSYDYPQRRNITILGGFSKYLNLYSYMSLKFSSGV